uniref:Uncharacterized protein n=1 Tax=Romanomermis culicivorax TaxID=13658 RepID=A0A915HS89_ROMCU
MGAAQHGILVLRMEKECKNDLDILEPDHEKDSDDKCMLPRRIFRNRYNPSLDVLSSCQFEYLSSVSSYTEGIKLRRADVRLKLAKHIFLSEIAFGPSLLEPPIRESFNTTKT